jgi:predicted dehydrogenase
LVAQVLPFFPEFAFIRRAIASGDFGKVKAAHFHRLISRPNWSSAIADASRTGGPVIDLHIHDVHFIALAFGPPRAVFSRGVTEAGAVAYVSTEYLFDTPEPVVSCLSGALSASGRPFVHGFEVFFENATLSFESANMGSAGTVVRPLAVIRADGTVEKPALGSDDPIEAFAAMLSSAIQNIETDGGAEGSPLAADLARQALSLCLAEIQSVECGAIVPIE